MNVLAIDTCGALGTVALARLKDGAEPDVLGQTEIPGKTYSAQLVPVIRDLLRHHGVASAEIEAIVVTSGPGSFTGIRIGLSTVKGLAEAHSVPLLSISRLAVLAHKAGRSAAALDASRHEFYLRMEGGESLLSLPDFEQQATALGRDLAVCEASVQAVAALAEVVEPPTAADALRCVLPRLRAGDFDDPLILDGNYLRRSDAEIFSKPARVAVPEP
ncbi:MAG TPA: tRNA (adenosine(37)-N6)-threonylcarbamoyltransferase complex dimerization subunit type 1 TsaB [Acidobacteriaceae bacterium]|jgi:tRNA threonylcarbamoyladenosine biosynthesis protein TsaB|nr:tRNA (adenosine(37)-N6)-threonylcarbamoyltransferase complex dimerization subunit type 1 TsaB [Acidobacteriaceae bacterium]